MLIYERFVLEPAPSTHRVRITVPETNTNEERLRVLLQQEREKNLQLISDYDKLQRRNLDLMKSLNNEKNEKEKLIQENQKLRNVMKKYRNSVISDHNYI